jgi:drug/metabolite transporter (DMT)-like permease
MQPIGEPAKSALSLDAKVILLALATATLTAAGTFFQKLNGVRAGNAFVSVWLLLATVCFFPTFVITNKVFLMGGRMSLFVPITAATYFFSMLASRFYFHEDVSVARWFGCGLIVAGVTVIAHG